MPFRFNAIMAVLIVAAAVFPPLLCGGTVLSASSSTIIAMFRDTSSIKVRRPAVAGSFYPSSAREIESMISGWLPSETDSAQVAPQALIVPHAGYVFSGEVAASAFFRIPRGHLYKRIFLLGPSHRVGFVGASVDTLYSFAQTPLGNVPVDTLTAKELVKAGDGAFIFREDAHDREHCLEVQLPFLQMAFDEVPPIVPVVIGTERLGVLQKIAEVLEPYFNEENLFVISSDFSHYPSYEDARASDLYMAETIQNGGLEEFLKALSYIRKRGFPGQDTAACGACAITVLLSMMDSVGRDSFEVSHIMYRNSGDSPYGDRDAVVGYNSFVVTRSETTIKNDSEMDETEGKIQQAEEPESVFNFTLEEKKGMISAARSSIYSALGLEYEEDSAPAGILKEKGYGVFVTLHLGGRLRGCIGRFTSSTSLDSTIREMARSAAFSDPRFPELTRNEAQRVEIEVSVLSPLKKIESIDEFKLGRDGIYMIKGYHHGTFLPQVAEETGWNTEEFLGHCAADKAGIGYYGWKDADLYTYQTGVVKESDVQEAER